MMDPQPETPQTSPSANPMTMVLIAGGALLLIGVGLIVWRIQAEKSMAPVVVTANPTPTPEPSTMMEKKEVSVVEFDGKKFLPATVTVKKGGTVKFSNTSTTHMEVASAPHPTHTIYPEFDQGKDSSQKDGNEYLFTFDKVGSWKYHNHTPFLPGGTVVVTE